MHRSDLSRKSCVGGLWQAYAEGHERPIVSILSSRTERGREEDVQRRSAGSLHVQVVNILAVRTPPWTGDLVTMQNFNALRQKLTTATANVNLDGIRNNLASNMNSLRQTVTNSTQLDTLRTKLNGYVPAPTAPPGESSSSTSGPSTPVRASLARASTAPSISTSRDEESGLAHEVRQEVCNMALNVGLIAPDAAYLALEPSLFACMTARVSCAMTRAGWVHGRAALHLLIHCEGFRRFGSSATCRRQRGTKRSGRASCSGSSWCCWYVFPFPAQETLFRMSDCRGRTSRLLCADAFTADLHRTFPLPPAVCIPTVGVGTCHLGALPPFACPNSIYTESGFFSSLLHPGLQSFMSLAAANIVPFAVFYSFGNILSFARYGQNQRLGACGG